MFNLKSLYTKWVNRLIQIFKLSTLTEKAIFLVIAVVVIFSGLSLIQKGNLYFTLAVPAKGGSLTEGIIGAPRFINPLLELSDADRDLSYLVYSGLMRATAEGNLVTDLAKSYSISEDGLTYTFELKDDVTFHDGTRITTDDIEFTVEMAQNIALRSPKRTNWAGVAISKIDGNKISFQLKQPYSPFLENATLGILPKHIWSSASADEFPFSPYNIEAIGSGPYKIEKINRNGSGIPISYEMSAFEDYALGEPHISNLHISFYQNDKALTEAFKNGEVESTGVLAPQILDGLKEQTNANNARVSLPRIFGLFFNQNQNKVFLNKEVRTALNMTVDRDRIVNEVLGGYGEAINGPIPNGVFPDLKSSTSSAYNKDEAIASAKSVLSKAGWKYNGDARVWEKALSKKETIKLSFTISTSNTDDLRKTAEILKEDWSLLGAEVTVQTFDPADLNQTVIAQRNYDALLFGQVVGRSLDLFAFWHSSQRLLGYNVALYTNAKVDKLLEDARQTTDSTKRLADFATFQTEIKNDIPAIFIYSPQFIYSLPNKVQGFKTGLINNRSERFEQIHRWYIETDQVWKFLIK
jgi:peptide/nickel transport system substrate-binding protein